MTMESLKLPQNGSWIQTDSESDSFESPASNHKRSTLDVVTECDSIDEVSESPLRCENKIKIVDPREFLHFPEADNNKRECHPYKGILRHGFSDMPAVLESTEQYTESGTQSAMPTLASPTEWHLRSPAQVHHEVPEFQTFPVEVKQDPDPRAFVPNIGPGGNGARYVIPGRGGFFLSDNVDPRTLFSAATGEMPAHQIHTPGSGLPQGIILAASSTDLQMPQQLVEETTRKRELRLMKNRERKKAYIRRLKNKCDMLERQNTELKQELEMYRNLHSLSAENPSTSSSSSDISEI